LQAAFLLIRFLQQNSVSKIMRKTLTMRIIKQTFSAIALALVTATAGAQAFPNKQVTIVVPFTPGSATDISARALQQKLSEFWGQPVIIENKAGAGGTIGAGFVAKAAPDGYTLLVHSSGHAANPAIYAKLPYDTFKDFTEVTAVAGQATVLIVAPSTGYKTLGDLLAAARSKPGTLNFGSAGGGSGTHLAGEKFKGMAKLDVAHIPYKGTPEAITDTMGGRLTYYFSPIAAALPLIREGKLTALAVSTPQRSSLLPDVPTLAQAGVPNFNYNLWTGMFAPAGTPPAIVEKIAQDVQRAWASPEVKERLGKMGLDPMPMTPAEFKAFVKSEVESASQVLKAAGVVPQ
jgi:tripartite-type tricarboxylate transporter receptor subunit TctC